MRPRLAFLADLLSDIAGSARRRERQVTTEALAVRREGELSANEMKKRLDATRARLKSERPPAAD